VAIRLDKPWQPLDREYVDALPGQLGVYEVADSTGTVLHVGVAGGRSLFGLRGELQRELEARGPGHQFRVEVNMQYLTRQRELLMAWAADHEGQLPPENAGDAPKLGRLSPG
jgi:hypothetical protein